MHKHMEEEACVQLRLSTGYVIDVNVGKPTTTEWKRRLATAIQNQRLLSEVMEPRDRMMSGWYPETIPEEICYLLVTTPPIIKDALLFQLLYEAIAKGQEAPIIEREDWKLLMASWRRGDWNEM